MPDTRHLLPRYGDLVIQVPVGIDELARALDAEVVAPWSRDREVEGREFLAGEYLVYARAEDDALPSLGLFLILRDGAQVEVANVVPRQAGSLTEAQYNRALEEFSRFVSVAVGRRGGKFRLDIGGYDLAANLGEVAYRALALFSRTSNRSTGTAHPSDKGRFFDFLVEAHKLGDRAPQSSWIGAWLQADGWPDDTAYEVAAEYEEGLALLRHVHALG